MKSLAEYITENTKWFVPFLKLFNDNKASIAKAAKIDGSVIDIRKSGSSNSPIFDIKYKNPAGMTMSMSFIIDPTNWNQSFKPMMMSGKRPMNIQYVNDLIKNNINILPALNFDRYGNILQK